MAPKHEPTNADLLVRIQKIETTLEEIAAILTAGKFMTRVITWIAPIVGVVFGIWATFKNVKL